MWCPNFLRKWACFKHNGKSEMTKEDKLNIFNCSTQLKFCSATYVKCTIHNTSNVLRIIIPYSKPTCIQFISIWSLSIHKRFLDLAWLLSQTKAYLHYYQKNRMEPVECVEAQYLEIPGRFPACADFVHKFFEKYQINEAGGGIWNSLTFAPSI